MGEVETVGGFEEVTAKEWAVWLAISFLVPGYRLVHVIRTAAAVGKWGVKRSMVNIARVLWVFILIDILYNAWMFVDMLPHAVKLSSAIVSVLFG